MAFTALNSRPQSQTVPVSVPVPQAVQAPAPPPAQKAITPAFTHTHAQEIDVAFAGNQDLRKRVHAAIGISFCG